MVAAADAATAAAAAPRSDIIHAPSAVEDVIPPPSKPPRPPVWHVRCRRCQRSLATDAQVVFLRESERSIHLALQKALLEDEQAAAERERSGTGGSAATRHTNWRLRSLSHVTPSMRFTKTRNQRPQDQVRVPFKVNCPNCHTKVASECQLDARPGAEFLLDSKSCECVVVADEDAASATAPLLPRKWGALLDTLGALQLPVHVEVVDIASVLALEVDVGGSSASTSDSDTVPANEDVVSRRYAAIAASSTPLPASYVVLPSTASVRASFRRSCKLSALRLYQVELVLSALLENTVVCLPTGTLILKSGATKQASKRCEHN